MKKQRKAKPAKAERLGFLAGQIRVPNDFDQMGSADIDRLFYESHRGSKPKDATD